MRNQWRIFVYFVLYGYSVGLVIGASVATFYFIFIACKQDHGHSSKQSVQSLGMQEKSSLNVCSCRGLQNYVSLIILLQVIEVGITYNCIHNIHLTFIHLTFNCNSSHPNRVDSIHPRLVEFHHIWSVVSTLTLFAQLSCTGIGSDQWRFWKAVFHGKWEPVSCTRSVANLFRAY